MKLFLCLIMIYMKNILIMMNRLRETHHQTFLAELRTIARSAAMPQPNIYPTTEAGTCYKTAATPI